jgi:hypothetical protein
LCLLIFLAASLPFEPRTFSGMDAGNLPVASPWARVLHNPVASTEPSFSPLEWRFAATVVDNGRLK